MQVKELTNGYARFRKVQTGHFIVFLARLAAKGNQFFKEFGFLVRGGVRRQRRALGPEQRDEKSDTGNNEGQDADFNETALFGVVHILATPNGNVFVGIVENGTNQATINLTNKKTIS